MNLDDSGVLFVVTGAHYTAAAGDAARSVAQTNPWLKIGIFSDQDVTDPVFTFVGKIQGDDSRRKHEYVGQSPFANTLYLDSDVRVIDDLSDLFRLLERYEMAGAHVRYRSVPKRLRKNKLDLPQAFPQINCGVLLYRKCGRVDALFQSWIDIYRRRWLHTGPNPVSGSALAIGGQVLCIWARIQYAQHPLLAKQTPSSADPAHSRFPCEITDTAFCEQPLASAGSQQSAPRAGQTPPVGTLNSATVRRSDPSRKVAA